MCALPRHCRPLLYIPTDIQTTNKLQPNESGTLPDHSLFTHTAFLGGVTKSRSTARFSCLWRWERIIALFTSARTWGWRTARVAGRRPRPRPVMLVLCHEGMCLSHTSSFNHACHRSMEASHPSTPSINPSIHLNIRISPRPSINPSIHSIHPSIPWTATRGAAARCRRAGASAPPVSTSRT